MLYISAHFGTCLFNLFFTSIVSYRNLLNGILNFFDFYDNTFIVCENVTFAHILTRE